MATTPTVVNANSGNQATATSVVMTPPSGLIRGNQLIAVLTGAAVGSALVQPNSRWKVLNNNNNIFATMQYIIQGDEPANWTWTWTTTTPVAWLMVQIANGIVRVGAVDGIAAQANASSGNITAPTVTPNYGADLLLSIYCCDAANAITVPSTQTGHTFGSSTGNTRSIIGGWENWLGATATNGTITSNGTNVTANDTVTVGERIYTFKTTATVDGDVKVAATATLSMTNLNNAINKSGGVAGTDYIVNTANQSVTSSQASLVLTLTSKVAGLIGNSITLSKSATTLTVVALSGGLDAVSATGTRVATATAAVNRAVNLTVAPANQALINVLTGGRSGDHTFGRTAVPIINGQKVSGNTSMFGSVTGSGAGAGTSNLINGTIQSPNAVVLGNFGRANGNFGGLAGRNPFPSVNRASDDGESTRGYAGLYKVAGYCLDATTLAPLCKQVFICPELSPVLCVASTFSDPITGFWEFDNLMPGKYVIQGHDPDQIVNDVVFAIVGAVSM